MRRLRIPVVVFGIVGGGLLGPQAASAFEQQTVTLGAPGMPTAGIELTVPPTDPLIGAGKSKTGAGITLPGLGSFGAFPKLDFGLELLYGSPEAASPAEPPADVLPDAFTVHGTVKKTF
jgi:hypothetical protein